VSHGDLVTAQSQDDEHAEKLKAAKAYGERSGNHFLLCDETVECGGGVEEVERQQRWM